MRATKKAAPTKPDALEEDAHVQHSAPRTPFHTTLNLFTLAHTPRGEQALRGFNPCRRHQHRLRRPPTTYNTRGLLVKYTPLTTRQQRAVHHQQL